MMMDSEEEEEQTALVCDNGKFGSTTKEIWSETYLIKGHDLVSKNEFQRFFIYEIFDALWQEFHSQDYNSGRKTMV